MARWNSKVKSLLGILFKFGCAKVNKSHTFCHTREKTSYILFDSEWISLYVIVFLLISFDQNIYSMVLHEQKTLPTTDYLMIQQSVEQMKTNGGEENEIWQVKYIFFPIKKITFSSCPSYPGLDPDLDLDDRDPDQVSTMTWSYDDRGLNRVRKSGSIKGLITFPSR